MDELHKAIGIEMPEESIETALCWGGTQAGTRVTKVALFPRV
jgi:hypothetical protein